MKTLFQSGFSAQRRFWMGISSINSTALDLEMDTYAKIQGWLASTPNPSNVLGTDYANFQSTNAEIRSLYDAVVAIADKARANQDLNDDEVTKANAFIRDAEFLWATIQAHPSPASAPPAAAPTTPTTSSTQAPPTPSPTTPPAGAAKPGAAPPAAAAPAAPPSGPDYSPLLIGGGIVAALLVVIVATK
jgi:hypothetical protein